MGIFRSIYLNLSSEKKLRKKSNKMFSKLKKLVSMKKKAQNT